MTRVRITDINNEEWIWDGERVFLEDAEATVEDVKGSGTEKRFTCGKCGSRLWQYDSDEKGRINLCKCCGFIESPENGYPASSKLRAIELLIGDYGGVIGVQKEE
jgi:hypothetical protein